MDGANHQQVQPLLPGQTFQFACHPGVACFTECCRALELALSPYDVLRLQNRLALTSRAFLDRYALIEWPEEALYPRVYLGMVDDGHASCPFISAHGCQVYEDRPGACRTYPVGRGAFLNHRQRELVHVLLREPHCQGFAESGTQNIDSWQQDQLIDRYNAYNDLLLPVLNHRVFNHNQRLSPQQAEIFLQALYDLDSFRPRLKELDPEIMANPAVLPVEKTKFLEFSINWLAKFLAGSI